MFLPNQRTRVPGDNCEEQINAREFLGGIRK
jgi:hypothetical protein